MQVLLLDDRADTDLRVAADALILLGHTVVPVSDVGAYQRVLDHGTFQAQVVDYALPGSYEAFGVRDGPELVALAAATGHHLPAVLLTNYPPDCARRVADFDPRLPTIVVAKPPSKDAVDWSAELAPAVAEVTSRAGAHGEPFGLLAVDVGSRFFHLTAEELHALTEDERDDLERESVLELHGALLPFWDACDADWVTLSKVNDVVLITDRGADAELPSLDDVVASEEDQNAGLLIVGRPGIIEEMSSHGRVACSPGGPKNWRGYPYVGLIVGTAEREFHLDTGNFESFISQEFLLAADVPIPRVKGKVRYVADMGGNRAALRQTPVGVVLHATGPHGNVELEVTLQAVRRWQDQSVLNHPCPGQLCPASQAGQCGRRHGLMGRDLLYYFTDGTWEFAPSSGRFSPLY